MLVDQIHNIRIAFSDYGTPYCFSITALKNGIDKPSDYSEKKIKKIEKRTQKKVAKMKKEKNLGKQMELRREIRRLEESYIEL